MIRVNCARSRGADSAFRRASALRTSGRHSLSRAVARCSSQTMASIVAHTDRRCSGGAPIARTGRLAQRQLQCRQFASNRRRQLPRQCPCAIGALLCHQRLHAQAIRQGSALVTKGLKGQKENVVGCARITRPEDVRDRTEAGIKAAARGGRRRSPQHWRGIKHAAHRHPRHQRRRLISPA